MRRITAIAAIVALGVLPSCVPPRDVNGAVDQDINAARDVGPVSGALVPAPVPNVLNIPLDNETPENPATPAPQPAAAPPPPTAGNAQSGHRFALETCTACHVIAPDQTSPLRSSAAPDFQTIANYPDTTPIRLNIWLRNPHPTMPSLVLSPQQAADMVTYILSLRATR